jgi:hypothetical protein
MEEDHIKTTFITTYAYTTMSFRSKNAGATYQRAIHLCFKNQLHYNVDVYVDDVVVKTRNHDDFISDLEETSTACSNSSGSLTRLSTSLAYH